MFDLLINYLWQKKTSNAAEIITVEFYFVFKDSNREEY